MIRLLFIVMTLKEKIQLWVTKCNLEYLRKEESPQEMRKVFDLSVKASLHLNATLMISCLSG